MAPFVVLVAVTLAARAMGAWGLEYTATWPGALAIGLAAMFVVTGLAHFGTTRRAGLIAIVPPSLPAPAHVVTVTGVLELAGAACLLVPPAVGPLRVLGAWALASLLVAMFPANVYASRARRSPHAPHTPLRLRAPLQALFVLAALTVALAT
ncbi:DoxX family protein [Microbacterium marinilacus]|uniref:DoxX family membrane protein n=1 Tax=Microbacterium marinilacus TaxID=415209 RepID=A0ABP7BU56_9MICO|nr:DoxX family protein [Microbacterium marinilacus]